MKLLLDTHVWIWSQTMPSQLGESTRAKLLDPANDLFVATISTMEIARLQALKRLQLTMDLNQWVNQSLQLLRAETLDISHEMAIEAYRLPEPFHRDPADRLLTAAARLHGLCIITADDAILQYPHVMCHDARK